MNILNKLLQFVAFGFGSGYSPKAPGTMGTVVGVLLFYFCMLHWPVWLYLSVLALASVLGVWLCGQVSSDLGVHDHPGIVWDEMVGIGWVFLLMVLGVVPEHWIWVLLAFGLFRLFDIWKPWPIRWLDKRVSGGFGIMLDDWVAAFYAALILMSLVSLTRTHVS